MESHSLVITSQVSAACAHIAAARSISKPAVCRYHQESCRGGISAFGRNARRVGGLGGGAKHYNGGCGKDAFFIMVSVWLASQSGSITGRVAQSLLAALRNYFRRADLVASKI